MKRSAKSTPTIPTNGAQAPGAIKSHEQLTFDFMANNQKSGAAELEAGENTIQFDPLSEIFPLLEDDLLQELAADIKKNGVLEPLTTYKGKLLDGRNRYFACGIAGVEPEYTEYTGNDPAGYVVSRNLHRRQLSDSQRAMVAAKLSKLERGANQHSKGLPAGKSSKILNVSPRAVARAKNVLKDGIPDVARAVDTGEIRVAAAEQIALQPKDKQHAALQARLEKKRKKKVNGSKTRGTNSTTVSGSTQQTKTVSPEQLQDAPADHKAQRARGDTKLIRRGSQEYWLSEFRVACMTYLPKMNAETLAKAKEIAANWSKPS